MYDAVICEPVRTPVGGFGGVFKDVPVPRLAATVVRGLVERTGITAPTSTTSSSARATQREAAAIGRVAALDAGLDVTVPGLDRPPLRIGFAGGHLRLHAGPRPGV